MPLVIIIVPVKINRKVEKGILNVRDSIFCLEHRLSLFCVFLLDFVNGSKGALFAP